MLSFKKFILETIFLAENRIEFLKSKFTDFDTSHDTFAKHKDAHTIIDHFADADPHPKKANTQWIINQYRKGHIRQEDTGRIHQTLSDFEQHKGKLANKDLNGYKHISEVDKAVEPHLGTKSKKQEKAQIKHEGADLVYDSPTLSVHKMKTKEAACHYGAGTKWCTAAKKDNMFDHYNKQGPLYVLNHKDTGDKHQFHFESDSFADEHDEMHDPHDLADRYPEIAKVPDFQDKNTAFMNKETRIKQASIRPETNEHHRIQRNLATYSDREIGQALSANPHIGRLTRNSLIRHHISTPGVFENLTTKHQLDSDHYSEIAYHGNETHHAHLLNNVNPDHIDDSALSNIYRYSSAKNRNQVFDEYKSGKRKFGPRAIHTVITYGLTDHRKHVIDNEELDKSHQSSLIPWRSAEQDPEGHAVYHHFLKSGKIHPEKQHKVILHDIDNSKGKEQKIADMLYHHKHNNAPIYRKAIMSIAAWSNNEEHKQAAKDIITNKTYRGDEEYGRKD